MKRYLPLIAIFAATPAFAHTGVDHVHSFASGLMHPFTGLDHLAAMLATGFIGSAYIGLKKLAAPAAFLAAMVAGYGLALSGMTLPEVETVILASVVVLGALCLLPQRVVTASLLAAGFAVFHGYAHGAEAGAAAALPFGAGFVVGSAVLMAAGMLAGSVFRGTVLRTA